jgi:hypothetical protein
MIPIQYNRFAPQIIMPEISTVYENSARGEKTHVMSEVDNSSEEGQAEIILTGDFSDFMPEMQSAAIAVVVGILNIPREQLKVMRVSEGSISLEVKRPKKVIEKLIALDESSVLIIQDLGIQQVRILYGLRHRS